jgi:hypothetical protein
MYWLHCTLCLVSMKLVTALETNFWM